MSERFVRDVHRSIIAAVWVWHAVLVLLNAYRYMEAMTGWGVFTIAVQMGSTSGLALYAWLSFGRWADDK